MTHVCHLYAVERQMECYITCVGHLFWRPASVVLEAGRTCRRSETDGCKTYTKFPEDWIDRLAFRTPNDIGVMGLSISTTKFKGIQGV